MLKRRSYLTMLGASVAVAGCNELAGSGTATPLPTGTRTARKTETDPVQRSLGEASSVTYERSLTVAEPTVQKQFGATGYDPFMVEAAGQFVVVRVSLDETYNPRTADQRTRADRSAAPARPVRYGRKPPAAHPTPRPPVFEPALSLALDGRHHRPQVTRLQHTSGEIAFDVPASSASSGYVSWRDPERQVQWELPDSILSAIPHSPSFTRSSVSISGWPWGSDGVTVSGEIENVGSHPGVYRSNVVVPASPSGHTAQLTERRVPAGTRTAFDESYRFVQGSAEDGTTEIVYDDGDSPLQVTVTRGE